MALNAPLVGDSPMGIVGESFFVQRSGILLEIDSPGRPQIRLHGELFLTTVRIAFVPKASERTGAISSIDIPLQGIMGESFEQPIFGANFLKGSCAVLPGRGFTGGTFNFRLYFYNGGCSIFLKAFFSIMEKYKLADEAARAQFFHPVRMQTFITEFQEAFVDPSDPTTIFIVQPPPPPAPAFGGAPYYGGMGSPPPGMGGYPAPPPPGYVGPPPQGMPQPYGSGGGGYAPSGPPPPPNQTAQMKASLPCTIQ